MQKKTSLRVVGILSRQGIVAIGAFAIATMLFIAGSGEALAQSLQSSPGYNQIVVLNCHEERRTVHLWIRDVTQDAPFVEKGSLPFSGGICQVPRNQLATRPLIIPLTDSHTHEFVAVDPEARNCGGQNNPNKGPCQRLKVWPILGDKDGQFLPMWVD